MMVTHRTIAAAVMTVILLSAALPSLSANDLESGAKKFIESLADKAINSLTRTTTPRAQRVDKFRRLFNESFAVATIGQWAIGRHWRGASSAERKQYLTLFEELMIVTYVDRFTNFAGDNLKVDKVLPNTEGTATVYSLILPQASGGNAVRVDWRVRRADGGFKVLDVVVEGTSMSTTLRSEFGSATRREGNGIAGLIKVLKKKTESLK
jgi:phospholipid transport system substrate-binding protein